MGSHSVTCNSAKVTFPPLTKPINARNGFSDCGWMQGWVGLVTYRGGIPILVNKKDVYTRPKRITHPSTNLIQRRVTSFMGRTTLPLRQVCVCVCVVCQVKLSANEQSRRRRAVNSGYDSTSTTTTSRQQDVRLTAEVRSSGTLVTRSPPLKSRVVVLHRRPFLRVIKPPTYIREA